MGRQVNNNQGVLDLWPGQETEREVNLDKYEIKDPFPQFQKVLWIRFCRSGDGERAQEQIPVNADGKAKEFLTKQYSNLYRKLPAPQATAGGDCYSVLPVDCYKRAKKKLEEVHEAIRKKANQTDFEQLQQDIKAKANETDLEQAQGNIASNSAGIKNNSAGIKANKVDLDQAQQDIKHNSAGISSLQSDKANKLDVDKVQQDIDDIKKDVANNSAGITDVGKRKIAKKDVNNAVHAQVVKIQFGITECRDPFTDFTINGYVGWLTHHPVTCLQNEVLQQWHVDQQDADPVRVVYRCCNAKYSLKSTATGSKGVVLV